MKEKKIDSLYKLIEDPIKGGIVITEVNFIKS